MKTSRPLRFCAWFFLLLFTYNLAGGYACLYFWKLYQHEQLEALAATLPDAELTLVKIDAGDSPGREICSGGKMYDMVRYTKRNGCFECYCLPDHEEDELMVRVNDSSVLGKEQGKTTDTAKRVLKKLAEHATAELLSPESLQLPQQDIAPHLFNSSAFSFHSEVLQRPPETVLHS